MISPPKKDLATRDAFGETLLALGKDNPRLVVVSCDLSSATRVKPFRNAYPDRFFEVGIAEQNGISIAAGLALSDFRPFIASFAAFITGRYDQIRTSLAYNQVGVVIVGTHAGLAIGKDGTTQMGLEDLNVMGAVPGIQIYQPADAVETQQIVEHLVATNELAYLRLSRTPQPNVHEDSYRFVPGRGHIMKDGTDVGIIATGDSVYHALQAARVLAEDGISAMVVNMSTLKPIDRQLIAKIAQEVPQFITVEDHNVVGGLGSRVCEVVAEENLSVPVLRHGVPDVFGESGTPEALYSKYRLDAKGIAQTVREAVHSRSRKQRIPAAPLISYHVVTWNRLPKLQNLLRSFIACNQYENFEWIFVDHGSTDGTIEFLEHIKTNPEFKYLWGRVKVLLFDERDYIAELKQRGIVISSPRRAAEAFFGKYRNEARQASAGDYIIDIPDDHQFIRKCNWIDEMLGIFQDRIRQTGKDDIASLVFKSRVLYRILKKNQATEPKRTTDSGVEYYVCRHKGYDDYGMVSRAVIERMGPYFQIDQGADPQVIAAWNDPQNAYFNSISAHYEHYLQRAQMLGLKKIMVKYPYTHDLLHNRYPIDAQTLAIPLTTLDVLQQHFSSLDRPIAFEELEYLLTGEMDTWDFYKTKLKSKINTFIRS